MRRFPVPVVPILFILTLPLILSGCGTLGRLTGPLSQAATTLFTNATLADLQMTGVKTGPVVPVQAGGAGSSALGSEIQQELAGAALARLGQAPLGVLLPISRVGETTPWWIFCPAGELQVTCEEIPPNARVNFSGRPLGRGVVLLPTHLTWSER